MTSADFKAQAVIPISTATGQVRPRIKVGEGPSAMAITPDGRTAYVLCSAGGVVPVSTATDTAEPPIPGIHSSAGALVIAP